MGTRAVYTFFDEDERYSVYKQWDGCPKWACGFIANALPLTWPLPRFEADDFAAAFVTANKTEAGDLRLTAGPAVHRDLAYSYEIRCQGGQLHLRIFRVRYHGPGYCWADYQPLFAGSLQDAHQFASTFN